MEPTFQITEWIHPATSSTRDRKKTKIKERWAPLLPNKGQVEQYGDILRGMGVKHSSEPRGSSGQGSARAVSQLRLFLTLSSMSRRPFYWSKARKGSGGWRGDLKDAQGCGHAESWGALCSEWDEKPQREENLEMGLSACCFRMKQRITVEGREETEDQWAA